MYLATLKPTMTPTEFFIEVQQASLAGNYPSVSEAGACYYRTKEGDSNRACLVGTFLPNKVYNGEGNLNRYLEFLTKNSPSWLTIELWYSLQVVHDTIATHEFKEWPHNMFIALIKNLLHATGNRTDV